MLSNKKTVSAIIQKYRLLLEDYAYGENALHDLIHVASIITSTCLDLGIECPVVVGGLAVETYTNGGYTTTDIDFVTDSMVDIHRVMIRLGFSAKEGYRYYCHQRFGDVVEFPSPPLNGSKDKVVLIDLPNGLQYYVIGIEDIIINRLEEFVHWDSKNLKRESATQIISILKAHSDRIDYDYLHEQASQKDVSDGLDILLNESSQSS